MTMLGSTAPEGRTARADELPSEGRVPPASSVCPEGRATRLDNTGQKRERHGRTELTGRLHRIVGRLDPILMLLVFSLMTFAIVLTSPCSALDTRKSTRIQGKDYVSINDAALLLEASKFWKVETRKAVLNVEGKRIRFTVGSPVVAVGDRTFVLRAPVLFIKGSPYIPVEFFTEILPQVLEKRVAWNADNKTLSLLRAGTVPVTLGLEASGEFTYLTISSPDKLSYSPVSLSEESFVILLENAIVSGRPHSGKAGLVRQLVAGQTAKGVELRMRLDSHVVGYCIKHETEPERVIVGFTSSEAEMRAAGFAPFGGERTHGVYRVVVIDAGHGGSDEGVRGVNGAVEKQINLEIAQEVRDIITQSGSLQVVLTRSEDSEQSPEERATKANEANGNIFVSIHCDGYASADAHGYSLEVYKAPDGSGASTSEVAIGEIQMSSWKSVAERHTRTSLSLATAISDRIGSDTNLRELGVRRVPAIALEGVDMPSALICCGFLTNSGDEAFLLDSASRHRIATTIAEGISEFAQEGPR